MKLTPKATGIIFALVMEHQLPQLSVLGFCGSEPSRYSLSLWRAGSFRNEFAEVRLSFEPSSCVFARLNQSAEQLSLAHAQREQHN